MIHKHVRTIGAAFLLGLAILSVPAEFAHARTYTNRASCEAAGFYWDSSKGCADQSCRHDGRNYLPGDIIHVRSPFTGRTINYMCDGWTGQWVVLRTWQESPQVPRPTTNGF